MLGNLRSVRSRRIKLSVQPFLEADHVVEKLAMERETFYAPPAPLVGPAPFLRGLRLPRPRPRHDVFAPSKGR